MFQRLKKEIFFGWFFAGFGVWGFLSVLLDWWMSNAKEFGRIASISPFYQQYIEFRLLPEVYLLIVVLSLLMVTTGFGFLNQKPWARACAFSYIILAIISGTSICVRYTQLYGREDVGWVIWPMWLLGIAFHGMIAFFLRRSTININFLHSPTWQAYNKIHWQLFNLGGRLFGLAAIFIGSVLGLWALFLLLNPQSAIPVNGVPTTNMGPKVVMLTVALAMVVIGALCLIAKPIVSGKPIDRPYQNKK